MKNNECEILIPAISWHTLTFCLLSLFFLQAMVTTDGQRHNLVSVEWLSKNLYNPGFVIVDASPAQVYKAGHIPGAVNYDLFSYGPGELPVPELEKRFRSWGISTDKKVIIYDQGGTMLATRLLFSLDYYGFPGKNINLLDGGLSKWKEKGCIVTTDLSPAPAAGTFTIKELNTAVKADLPEFLNASGDPEKSTLVEALDPSWHYGELNVFGRRGHIPHAIMLPVSDFYNEDKTFKTNEEIKKILDYLGINQDKKIFTHCGGGIAASVPYFVMKHLLGWSDVKLFPGSLLEWEMDERELPVWTYDKPYLLRDAGWLQGWGGKMMRMYGISNVSFIDVRPEESYNKGHVEYAVHLSPGDLEANFSNPDKMAELLSASGVNASSEAVIMTGGGLTKEGALAFAALDKAGQKKISLFMGNANNWEQDGFKLAVSKDENEPGSAKNMTVRGNYGALVREGIIINEIKREKGIFPELLIDCGEQESAGTGAEKTVHVPYKDLLNSDGSPKMEKEIWNVLAKAGVPRYAGLVCFSDDPGEAAVVYFILKLMGFPDVKILQPVMPPTSHILF